MRKELKQLVNVTDDVLTQHINEGWQILHMEFQPIIGKITAGKAQFALCVVIQRDCEAQPESPGDAHAAALTPIERAMADAINTGMFEETLIEFDDDSTGDAMRRPPTENVTVLGLPDSPTDNFPSMQAERGQGGEVKKTYKQQLDDAIKEFKGIPAFVDMWQIPLTDAKKLFVLRDDWKHILNWINARDSYNIVKPDTPPKPHRYSNTYPFTATHVH